MVEESAVPYRKSSPSERDRLQEREAYRELLVGYHDGRVGNGALREATRALASLWLARTREGWRHHEERGARHVVVGLDANSLAFFGDPVEVSVDEALLQVFAGAEGVLLDPRGPLPTKLSLSVVYGITGTPGMVPYEGTPLRARTHGEVHAYLDELAWPQGWRGHRFVALEGSHDPCHGCNEYRSEGAPEGRPKEVRFFVDETSLDDDLGLGISALFDAVGWIVKSDQWGEWLVRQVSAKAAPEVALLAYRRVQQVIDCLEQARSCLLANAPLLTSLSRLAAQIAPTRLSYDGVERELKTLRERLAAILPTITRERDMGDPLEQRAEGVRARIASNRFAPTFEPDPAENAARVHLLRTSEDPPTLRAVLRELVTTVRDLDAPIDPTLVPGLPEVALTLLRSEDLLIVDEAFGLAEALLRHGHRPTVDGLVRLFGHREHVHYRERLLSLVDGRYGFEDHLGVQNMLAEAIDGEDPRILAAAMECLPVAPPPRAALRAMGLLAHPSPTVRWHAVCVLGRSEHRPAIAAIAGLLDDTAAPVGRTMFGWLRWVAHEQRGLTRIQGAAVFALARLSRLTDEAFAIPIESGDTLDRLAEAVDEAKSWYARNASSL